MLFVALMAASVLRVHLIGIVQSEMKPNPCWRSMQQILPRHSEENLKKIEGKDMLELELELGGVSLLRVLYQAKKPPILGILGARISLPALESLKRGCSLQAFSLGRSGGQRCQTRRHVKPG